jgi:hypothetical protein
MAQWRHKDRQHRDYGDCAHQDDQESFLPGLSARSAAPQMEIHVVVHPFGS